MFRRCPARMVHGRPDLRSAFVVPNASELREHYRDLRKWGLSPVQARHAVVGTLAAVHFGGGVNYSRAVAA